MDSMIRMFLTMKQQDFLETNEDYCQCCGAYTHLRAMMRPLVQPLSDELLIKMSEEFGQAYTEEYHLSSRKYTKTRECSYCRNLPDDKFFVLVAVREDR